MSKDPREEAKKYITTKKVDILFEILGSRLVCIFLFFFNFSNLFNYFLPFFRLEINLRSQTIIFFKSLWILPRLNKVDSLSLSSPKKILRLCLPPLISPVEVTVALLSLKEVRNLTIYIFFYKNQHVKYCNKL